MGGPQVYSTIVPGHARYLDWEKAEPAEHIMVLSAWAGHATT